MMGGLPWMIVCGESGACHACLPVEAFAAADNGKDAVDASSADAAVEDTRAKTLQAAQFLRTSGDVPEISIGLVDCELARGSLVRC